MKSQAKPYVGPPLPESRRTMALRVVRWDEVIPDLERQAEILRRKRGDEEFKLMQAKIDHLKSERDRRLAELDGDDPAHWAALDPDGEDFQGKSLKGAANEAVEALLARRKQAISEGNLDRAEAIRSGLQSCGIQVVEDKDGNASVRKV